MTRSTGRVSELLRRETRSEHDRIEHALAWESRVEVPEDYRLWLLQLHGFHRVWEPAVAVALADPAFFEPRRKLHLLRTDLRRLGATDAEIAAIGAPSLPEPLTSRADALGSMYVLEGSTLGGQIIARRVRSSLQFEPCYHLSYGNETGRMWRSFQEKLEDDLLGNDVDRAIGSARRTFACLRELLQDPRLTDRLP